MRFVTGYRSDRGLVRDVNEDAFFVDERCLAVADGMGGHQAGEVASKMAIDQLSALDKLPSSDDEWRALMLDINRVVLVASRFDRRRRGMGTTLTLAALVGNELVVAHAGDSRAYLVREGQIKQLTEDHSLVQTLVSAGTITEEEAMRHSSRNVITSAIGVDKDPRIDVIRTSIRPSDVVVVCTDGLSSLVTEGEMQSTLAALAVEVDAADRPQAIADSLTAKALERGGHDNVTVIVGLVTS
jgi:serine/threonine protein phosphatase PrpC